jgi:hypothetical protein
MTKRHATGGRRQAQLMSQPFFYIFAVIVIALIFIFGFNYIEKILKLGCEVEVIDFNNDIQSKINEISSLSFGSSYECSLVTHPGQTESRCELVLPSNIKGICFVDTTKISIYESIKFADIKKIVELLGVNSNKNLFYSLTDVSCDIQPAKINKIKMNEPVCLDLKNNKFIIENSGITVEVKKSE